jgi:DNA modification methylase
MVTKLIAKKLNPRKEVQAGDLWILGDHRLVCGSASDKEAVEKAVGGGSIRQILTDPPFGVNYATKDSLEFRKITKEWENIKQDQLQSDEQYSLFTKDWLSQIKQYLSDYNTFYIFNSDSMICGLRQGIKEAEYYYSQLIIWVKNTPVMGHRDYLPQHELIAYGWHGRHKMERAKAKSVIFYPKPHRSSLHPTMKPVGLLRKLIENSTKIGESVYDPFGGSGSTLIACEQFKRKCAMIELDPNYCSTIIQRWEILTGGEARKVD